MESVLRAAAVYAIVWIIFRFAGRRSLSEMTSFDFILLLICGEATQQALLGDDFSITNAALVVLTLVGIDIALSELKQKLPKAGDVMDGFPTVLVANGQLLKNRADHVRVDEEDVLDEARKRMGLVSLDQIEYAVLERNGGISIIPKPQWRGPKG